MKNYANYARFKTNFFLNFNFLNYANYARFKTNFFQTFKAVSTKDVQQAEQYNILSEKEVKLIPEKRQPVFPPNSGS